MEDKKVQFALMLTNKDFLELLTTTLLQFGIISYPITPDEILQTQQLPKDTQFIIADFDYGDGKAEKALRAIKGDKESFPLLTVGTSINNNHFTKELTDDFNIVGILNKPIVLENFKQTITRIITKFADHFPERRHIRIKPDPEEYMRISFKINEKHLSGKILDLSLSGLAIQMYSHDNEIPVTSGQQITDAIINLRHRDYAYSIEAINVKGNFIGAKFINMTQEQYAPLSNYILRTIINEEKHNE